MTLSNLRTNDKKLIVGYTTITHLVLDLDNTSLYKVMKLAKLLRENYREIGDILILESSSQKEDYGTRIDKRGMPKHTFKRNSYHLVGNNILPYRKLIAIINALVDLDILPQDYKTIRAFRGDMTVRVSPMSLTTHVKPIPKPVAYLSVETKYKQDGMIDIYRRFRMSVARFFLADSDAKAQANYEGNRADNAGGDGTVDVMP